MLSQNAPIRPINLSSPPPLTSVQQPRAFIPPSLTNIQQPRPLIPSQNIPIKPINLSSPTSTNIQQPRPYIPPQNMPVKPINLSPTTIQQPSLYIPPQNAPIRPINLFSPSSPTNIQQQRPQNALIKPINLSSPSSPTNIQQQRPYISPQNMPIKPINLSPSLSPTNIQQQRPINLSPSLSPTNVYQSTSYIPPRVSPTNFQQQSRPQSILVNPLQPVSPIRNESGPSRYIRPITAVKKSPTSPIRNISYSPPVSPQRDVYSPSYSPKLITIQHEDTTPTYHNISNIMSEGGDEYYFEDSNKSNSIIGNPYLESVDEKGEDEIVDFPYIKTTVDREPATSKSISMSSKIINNINMSLENVEKTDFGISLEWDIITDEGVITATPGKYTTEISDLPKTLAELKHNIHKITGNVGKSGEKRYLAEQLRSLIIHFKCGDTSGKVVQLRRILLDYIESTDVSISLM